MEALKPKIGASMPETTKEKEKRFEVVRAEANEFGATRCLKILVKPVPGDREIMGAMISKGTIVPEDPKTGREQMYVIQFPGENFQEILSFAGLIGAIDTIRKQEKRENTG